MEKLDILLLYEKAVRELDVACLIKYLAENLYGLRVEVAQQCYSQPRLFRKFLRPKLIVLPFCYQPRSQNQFLIKWRKSVFFNLTWEQLSYKGNRTAKTPRGEFALNHVIHHSWSNDFADLLKSKGVPQKNIFLNGNLALTLYQEPYCRFFKQRSDLAKIYKIDPQKKWIFFPENFNWAFYDDAMLKQMINEGQPSQQVFEMQDFSKKSFNTVIKWCDNLAKRGDTEIIIRPRPATSIDSFIHRILQTIPSIFPKMHIINNESVREWVLASNTVISSYSTTLIEGAIAGKKVFMLEPIPFIESIYQGWYDLLPHIRNEEEFLSLAKNEDLKNGFELEKWARKAVFQVKDPIRNLVEYLNKICQGEVEVPPAPSRKSITLGGQGNFPWWYYYWKNKFSLLVRKPRKPLIEPIYVNDVKSQHEIPQRTRKWGDTINRFSR